jgi:hypothetical protein
MADVPTDIPAIRPRFPGTFPRIYPWLFLFAVLDLGVTSVILALGGEEVNAVADRALQSWGIPGLIAVKAASLAVLIGCCELIARNGLRGRRTGMLVAVGAAATTCVPVAYGSAQLGHALLIEQNPLLWEAIVLSEPLDQVIQRHERDDDLRARKAIDRQRARAQAREEGDRTLGGLASSATALAPAGF